MYIYVVSGEIKIENLRLILFSKENRKHQKSSYQQFLYNKIYLICTKIISQTASFFLSPHTYAQRQNINIFRPFDWRLNIYTGININNVIQA